MLIWRLADLQVVQHDEMLRQAANQQLKDTHHAAAGADLRRDRQGCWPRAASCGPLRRTPARSRPRADQRSSSKALGGEESGGGRRPRRAAKVSEVSAGLAELLGLEYQEVDDKLIDGTKQYVVLAKQMDKPVADRVEAYAREQSCR